MNDLTGSKITIYYDGECPFCRSYVDYADLKRRYGQVELIDARHAPGKTADFLAAGYNLDDGFIVEINGELRSGGDAMWVIHSALTPKDKAIAHIRSRRFLNFIYPALRVGRNLILRLLGKKKLNNQP